MTFSKKRQAKIRLFCFHYGGGGSAVFSGWQECLPESIEVIGVVLPGREYRFTEPLLTDLNIVLARIMAAIIPYLDTPYIFFGHSLGGLLCHQLLLKLILEGFTPARHLIVSGRSAPQDSTSYYDKISHLPDDQFLKKLPEYGGTPAVLLENRELMNIYLPILRSDFLLAESENVIAKKIPCPITVFGGNNDRMRPDDLRLWEMEAAGPFDLKMFRGGHFFISEQKKAVLNSLSNIVSKSLNDLDFES